MRKKMASIGILAMVVLFIFVPHVQAVVNYTPANPNVDERVDFTLIPIGPPPSVTWNFGDGTTMTGGVNISHTYRTAGTFTVRATYFFGGPITETTNIAVNESRRIEFSPLKPRENQNVRFRALNFLSSTFIRWDFGDGTIIDDTSPPEENHRYSAPGIYIVRAYDGGGPNVSAQITIEIFPPASISFTPSIPHVGQEIRFTAQNFFSASNIRWDFGDGRIMNDTSPPVISHTYNNPGIYLVRAYDGGGVSVTASISIRILPPGTITFTPSDPRAGEQVLFTAVNFSSNNLIRWDFGDGTVEQDFSPPQISHAFHTAGTFLVKAYDGDSPIETATTLVNVSPPRLVTFSPSQPLVGEDVVFRAFHFVSPIIDWDFGDGSVLSQSPAQIVHAFAREGNFTVTAYDYRGSSRIAHTIQVVVLPTRGPRAQFQISFIQLRFDDGKYYKVVPMMSDSLVAYADIKYEGTGILHAQWLVDGHPFRLVTRSLPFAGQTMIDSGTIPALPTLIPGLHEVSLRIFQPNTEYSAPLIRYFVTSQKILPNQVELILTSLSQDRMEALIGEHFVLKGSVKNLSDLDFKHLLMRIYFETKLIDQKLIRDLVSTKNRTFESSVFFASEEQKKIYITLYDISKKPPVLLSIRSIDIIPAKKK
jgi:PKD repeat protein